MSDCKENVLEMIRTALTANKQVDFCRCKPGRFPDTTCTYCKIDKGLTMAEACIIASVGRLDVMRVNMSEVQKEIETKLKWLLEE